MAKSSFDVIVRPVLTEKALLLQAENKVTFEVSRNSNKTEIKKAVEEIFNVKVEKVNKLNTKPQKRRVGKYEGYKRNWTKAIITLKEGSEIKLFGE